MNQLSFLPSTSSGARRPVEPIMRSALLEPPYRWELRRQWGTGPCIGFVGLNPSTADETADDPTMWREMAFSNAWGFGSLIKVNLFPFIASQPKAMREWRNGPDYFPTFERNIREAAAALVECTTLVAAWGNGVDDYDAAAFVMEIERRLHRLGPLQWMCLGRNANGSPVHTLARGKRRVPDDAELTLWRGET